MNINVQNPVSVANVRSLFMEPPISPSLLGDPDPQGTALGLNPSLYGMCVWVCVYGCVCTGVCGCVYLCVCVVGVALNVHLDVTLLMAHPGLALRFFCPMVMTG